METASSGAEVHSEHLRSDSSDSFVCVSERSHNSPETERSGDWECLKMADLADDQVPVLLKSDEARETETESGSLLLKVEVERETELEKRKRRESEGERTLDKKRERISELEKEEKEGGGGERDRDTKAVGEASDWESWDD